MTITGKLRVDGPSVAITRTYTLSRVNLAAAPSQHQVGMFSFWMMTTTS